MKEMTMQAGIEKKKYISVDTNLKLSTLSDAVCLGQDFKEFFKDFKELLE